MTKKFLNDTGLQHVFGLITSFVKNYASPKTHNHDGVYAKSSHNHNTSNITSGTFPIGRGGTGASNSKGAQYNIMKDILEGTVNASDSDVFVLKHHTPSATDGALLTRSAAQVWAWIKSKCDGLYQPRGSYASSSHTHTIANVSNLQSALDSKASVSHTHSNATATASGFMSNTDKSKLDGVSAGANKTIVDASFSTTSTNPVQNKVVKAALDTKASSSHTHTTSQVSGLDAALSGKAPTSHTHTMAQVTNLQSQLDSKVPVGRLINKKPLSADITLSAADVKADAAGAANNALNSAKQYTDTVAAGKAPTSHNHAASNITSGTLAVDRLPIVPVENGGTGVGYKQYGLSYVYNGNAKFLNFSEEGNSSRRVVCHDGSVDGSLRLYDINDHFHKDATTSDRGFMPKLSGNSSQFLNGNGQWVVPQQRPKVIKMVQGSAGAIGHYVVNIEPSKNGITVNRFNVSDFILFGNLFAKLHLSISLKTSYGNQPEQFIGGFQFWHFGKDFNHWENVAINTDYTRFKITCSSGSGNYCYVSVSVSPDHNPYGQGSENLDADIYLSFSENS